MPGQAGGLREATQRDSLNARQDLSGEHFGIGPRVFAVPLEGLILALPVLRPKLPPRPLRATRIDALIAKFGETRRA